MIPRRDGENAEGKQCHWVWEYEGYFDTDCEKAFMFNEGGPEANNFVYCPYCGRKIVEVYEI